MTTSSEAIPGARLAEEARLLLDVLAERLQPWLDRMASEHREHEATGQRPITCEWCPFCAGLAVLRGERPELAVRAAEHAAGLLAVLRAALADPTPAPAPASGQPRSGQPGSGDSAATQPDESPVPDSPRVQRISVRRPGDTPSPGDTA